MEVSTINRSNSVMLPVKVPSRAKRMSLLILKWAKTKFWKVSVWLVMVG